MVDMNPSPATYKKICAADLRAITTAFKQFKTAKTKNTIQTVLEPWNNLWILIDKSLGTANLYHEVHPNKKIRDIATTHEQQLQKITTNITLSQPIYKKFLALDTNKEDPVTRRHVDYIIRDFRRAGVDKKESAQKKIRALREEIVKIGQDFSKNIREDVRSITLTSVKELDGLPADFIAHHTPDAKGNITITTDYPDYIPYMSYAHNDARRLELYKASRTRGVPTNLIILKTLIDKRHTLAHLLGYTSYADYITEDKMIKTANNAHAFIEEINNLATARAKKDYAELLAQLKKINPQATIVHDWQKAYVEEHVKRTKYKMDSQEVRHYFAYDKIKHGVLTITSTMFGVTYRRIDAKVWHPSVEAYTMHDSDGILIGSFYLDMHPRNDKFKHAAAFPIQTGVFNKQLPQSCLVCNFPGGDETSGFMEHDDVETFFHEFGHLLHHLFAGRQRWIGVSGISTEWDFVEAPSQMLEEWAWDYNTLKTFATNEQGRPIPKKLVERMRNARDFGKGLWITHQLFYAAMSLHYYNRDPARLDTTAVMRDLQKKYSLFPYIEDTYMQASFGHLDGYSAIYYTYMWSLVIAKDLFSLFEKNGLLHKKTAQRYRTNVLEPGGSKDAAHLIKDFLQRDYTLASFAHWLNTK